MTTAGWIALIVAVVVIVAIVLIAMAATKSRRRRHLREQFGDEYDYTVERSGKRNAAERELQQREQRHDSFNLRELDPAEQAGFRERWEAAQSTFVDSPAAALTQADSLVQVVMSRRGYPMTDFDQRTADLSVEHADVVHDYRQAHDIAETVSRGTATTEQMRRAMVLYRSLFASLLGTSTAEPMTPGAHEAPPRI